MTSIEKSEAVILDGYMNFYDDSRGNGSNYKDEIGRAKEVTKKNEVDKFAGVFFDEYDYGEHTEDEKIIPGLYIPVDIAFLNQKRFRNLLTEEGDSYEFVELNSNFGLPTRSINEISEVIDLCLDCNFTKFQIHTKEVGDIFLDILEEKVEENEDVLFYLVHGANSLFKGETRRTLRSKIEKIEDLEENLFLGTSPGIARKITPNYIERLINEGLEDLLVFESNFGPGRDDSFYKNAITRVLYSTESYSNKEKILSKNLQRFLK